LEESVEVELRRERQSCLHQAGCLPLGDVVHGLNLSGGSFQQRAFAQSYGAD
jgi:hypothetical protein